MAVKDRGQSLGTGDTVRLKLLAFTNGDYADVEDIDKVEIYKLFCTDVTEENPLGRQIIETIDGDDVVNDETGKYHIDVELTTAKYTIGRFQDVWHVQFEPDQPIAESEEHFQIFPKLWFTDSRPIVHDFDFSFTPNRVVKGSRKYINIDIIPRVPRGTDKEKFYLTLISSGTLYITLEQKTGDCVPDERDLRYVVDDVEVTERDGCKAYYWLDTDDIDCGIYNVRFKLTLGTNIYWSEPHPLQIFD